MLKPRTDLLYSEYEAKQASYYLVVVQSEIFFPLKTKSALLELSGHFLDKLHHATT